MPRFSLLYGMLKVVVIASMNISMCHIMVFFWRGGTKRKKIFRLLVFCVVALIERPSNEFADWMTSAFEVEPNFGTDVKETDFKKTDVNRRPPRPWCSRVKRLKMCETGWNKQIWYGMLYVPHHIFTDIYRPFLNIWPNTSNIQTSSIYQTSLFFNQSINQSINHENQPNRHNIIPLFFFMFYRYRSIHTVTSSYY